MPAGLSITGLQTDPFGRHLYVSAATGHGGAVIPGDSPAPVTV